MENDDVANHILNLDISTESANLEELFVCKEAMLGYYFDGKGLSFFVVVLMVFLCIPELSNA